MAPLHLLNCTTGKQNDAVARTALEVLARHKSGEYVLHGAAPTTVSRVFHRTAETAGVGGSVHLRRHTFASELVVRGVPLSTVQQLLGPAIIEMTQKYARLCPQHIASAMATLSL